MISPLAYIDPTAKIGRNVTIYPFAFIDKDVEIGDDCVIMPYASVMNGTRMGKNNKIYQGAVIGADPQDFRWDRKTQTYCHIGDDNTIREQVIINRGIHAHGGTHIGDFAFIMAGSHIGHDCDIKGHCVIGNGVTMAGEVVVEEFAILSSNSVFHEKSHIGQWALIKGGCRINGNVPPYVIMAHNPVEYGGINAHVLRKRGFAENIIDDIAKAYRHIYQSGTSVFNALKRVEGDIEDSAERRRIIDFIRKANLSIVAVPVELE